MEMYIGPVERIASGHRAELFTKDGAYQYVVYEDKYCFGEWTKQETLFSDLNAVRTQYKVPYETAQTAREMKESEDKAPNTEAKADTGKSRLHLVPPQIVYDICEVREYGNRKYHDPDNWRTVEPIRYVDALLRHTMAFMKDPKSKDDESGIEHYKHMACNLAFLCEMFKEEK